VYLTNAIDESYALILKNTLTEREEIEQRNAKELARLLQESLDLNIVSYSAYGNQTGINLTLGMKLNLEI
jgi:cystathionine beta-lyase/cystathionine gamma-synthase